MTEKQEIVAWLRAKAEHFDDFGRQNTSTWHIAAGAEIRVAADAIEQDKHKES